MSAPVRDQSDLIPDTFIETKTEAEVVLTPFLIEVKQRAEALGFAAEAIENNSGPWLSVVLDPEHRMVLSIWNLKSYILTAQVQDIDPVELVASAVRVANAAMALLAEDTAEASL